MTSKAYNYLVMISGVICGYVRIKSFFFIHTRPVRTDVIQGILVGLRVGDRHGLYYLKDQVHQGQRVEHHIGMRRTWQRHVDASRVCPGLSRPNKHTARGDVLDYIRR
ncbi:MAG: hypothetical protein ABFD08_04995 [Syntrophomonas sp.]